MRARILGLAGAAFGLALAFSAPASADVLLPGQGGPTLSCGLGPTNNCLQFSDFTVFSLSLLQFQATGTNSGPHSGDAYYVPSSPGILNQDAITIFTGSSGVSNPIGPIDQPYPSPNAVPQGALANFAMIPPDPSPSFTGDNIHQPFTTVNNPTTPVAGAPGGIGSTTGALPLWDIGVDALKTFLGTGSLDFFFNLNQTKAAGDATYLLTPQDMLAYMAVTLTSADGLTQHTWYLNGNNCTGIGGACNFQGTAPQTAGVNDILPTANDQWAYVHGTVCAAPDGTVVWLGHCSAAPFSIPAGSKDVDQNLGANNASFALYSDALNTALRSATYAGGTLSVDARMAALNNGFEQLFIIAGNAIPNTDIPEPLTITLFGAGLAGAGLLRRRKARKSNV